MRFNGTLLLSLFYQFAVCPVAQQQTDSPQNNALPGSRFTGNYRETGTELDVQLVNQGEILYI